MELPECLSVRDCDKCDPLVLHVLIEVALDVDAHGRGALVQDRVDRLVIDQARHCHTLLLTSRQHVVPVVLRLPATLTLHQVFKLDLSENRLKFLLVNAFAFHILDSVRVDNLIAQCSLWQVGSLGDVEDLINGWLLHAPTEHRPQLAQDTEQRRFPTTVGSRDEKMHAGGNIETHRLN